MPSGNRIRSGGFTLLEMTIVMIIIALVTGVVFTGVSMLRSAKMNNAVSDLQRYSQAVVAFADKYQSFPGDMPIAERYWGSDAGCPNTPYTIIRHVATCNGDGDGFIDGPEEFRAWQQLSNAGFINGLYTGVAGPAGGDDHVARVNAPASLLDGGGFDITYVGRMTGDANYFDGYYPIKIGLGMKSANSRFDAPLLTPAEAFAIDNKIDDGRPGTGSLMPFKSTLNPGCTTTDVPETSLYVAADGAYLCSLNYIVTDMVH